ncbi:hypothetical protein AVEN_112316-1, partial [Araneus ventricosus]
KIIGVDLRNQSSKHYVVPFFKIGTPEREKYPDRRGSGNCFPATSAEMNFSPPLVEDAEEMVLLAYVSPTIATADGAFALAPPREAEGRLRLVAAGWSYLQTSRSITLRNKVHLCFATLREVCCNDGRAAL